MNCGYPTQSMIQLDLAGGDQMLSKWSKRLLYIPSQFNLEHTGIIVEGHLEEINLALLLLR